MAQALTFINSDLINKKVTSDGGLADRLVKAGKSDGEILHWINETAEQKRTPWEIEQWSEYMLRRGPDSDAETRGYFGEMLGKISQTREDITTWGDLLDLDDYVSFGGKA